MNSTVFSSFWASLCAILVSAIATVLPTIATPTSSDQTYDHHGQALPLPEKVGFNSHIRGVMSNTCFSCHGPDQDSEHSETDVRFDSFEEAVDVAGAIEPGDASASYFYQRIVDEDDPMPPPEFLHQLTDYEKALFKKWIDDGAKYEQHWAYAPISRPSIPQVDGLEGQTKNPIDAFVIARLQRDGLKLSPRADKRTLLRRLSLDLTGLPPTVAEINAFLEDDSETAYRKQVERLLASSHYGERMAAFWLDIIRYSDTVGFHGDQNQRIFPYRDYVIDSLNRNQPFDEFTKEQLAGDLLSNPTDDQLTATGLIRLNLMTREGGAQPEEYLAKYTADRVRMLGTGWLGATTGCCECHNHKYDPFSIDDFYSLGAFFDDVQQWGVYTSYGYSKEPDLRGFNNNYPFPPELRRQSRSLKQQLHFLEKQKDAVASKQLEASVFESDQFKTWLIQMAEIGDEGFWTPLRPATETTKAKNQNFEFLDDHSLRFVGKKLSKAEEITIEFEFDEPTDIRSIQVEILPDEAHDGFVGRGKNGQFTTTVQLHRQATEAELTAAKAAKAKAKAATTKVDSGPKPEVKVDKKATSKGASKRKKKQKKRVKSPTELSVAFAIADRFNPRTYVSGSPPLYLDDQWVSGPTRWQQPVDEARQPHVAVFALERTFRVGPGQPLKIIMTTADVGRVRFSMSPFARAVAGSPAANNNFAAALQALRPENADAFSQTGEQQSPAAEQFVSTTRTSISEPFQQFQRLPKNLRSSVKAAYYQFITPFEKQTKQVNNLRREIAKCRSGLAMTLISQPLPAKEHRKSRVLPRGDWQDKSGELVKPNTPHFLPGHNKASEKKLTRLDLANWLTSSENPLPARHYVNRVWTQFFGTGLSAVVDDLGNQGEWPSHPLLLDWLASEFQSNWDRKHIVRLIVTSQTYQQQAAVSADLVAVDPYNRLLGQQAARRLEAEIVRDNALAISGLLNLQWVGGPSVKPYQPDGYYSNLQFPSRRYEVQTDGRQYRRGVYMHWQRTFLHPMLANFDAPARDECVANRNQSNSPQQALTLLNDPVFNEAARAFAYQTVVQSGPKDIADWLEVAFERALTRSPTENERKNLTQLYQTQKQYFENKPDDAKKYLSIGQFSQKLDLTDAQYAALAQVCRVILNLHETITRY